MLLQRDWDLFLKYFDKCPLLHYSDPLPDVRVLDSFHPQMTCVFLVIHYDPVLLPDLIAEVHFAWLWLAQSFH